MLRESPSPVAVPQVPFRHWSLLVPMLGAIPFRIWFSLHTGLSGDQVAVYESALRFYKTGQLGPKGAAIVYTLTALPGGLLDLLVGMPLWVSGGLPWGPAAWIALLNWLFVFLLFHGMARAFPQWDRRFLAWWIFWAPWTFLYTDICNPSFVPILGLAFYWALLRLMEKPQDFWGAAVLAGSIVAYVQIHLSFVVCVGVLAACLALGWVRVPRLRGMLAGAGAAGLTLIPYAADRLRRGAAAEPNSFLVSNIHFDWVHFSHEWKIFTRFLSFASGETTRFLGTWGGGFAGAIEHVKAEPVLWGPFAIGYPLSLAITVAGAAFFARRETYLPLIEAVKARLGRRRPSPPASVQGRLGSLAVISVAMLMGQYLFAIKEPSAHTFLGLLPLCFVPVLTAWDGGAKRVHWAFAMAYSLCVSFYSAIGYQQVAWPTLWRSQEVALEQRRGVRPLDETANVPPRVLALIRDSRR